MGLRESLKRILGNRATRPGTEPDKRVPVEFVPDYDSYAVNFRIAPQSWADFSAGGGSGPGLEQYTVLSLLEEQGDAIRLPNGFRIDAEDIARLDSEISDLLGLPGRIPGAMHTEITGNTTSNHFRVDPFVEVEGIRVPIERHGATITVGAEEYVLTPFELNVLKAD